MPRHITFRLSIVTYQKCAPLISEIGGFDLNDYYTYDECLQVTSELPSDEDILVTYNTDNLTCKMKLALNFQKKLIT